MSDREGPWGRETTPEPPPRRKLPNGRVMVWLGSVAAFGIGIWLLNRAFPDTLRTADDWGRLATMLAALTILSLGLVSRRLPWREMARNGAIWAGVFLVAAVGVTYRAELSDVVQRVRGQFSPSHAVASGAHELVVTENGDGGFNVMGEVNGQPVRFMIDTGASETVLSLADAKRLGVDVGALKFDQPSETANGVGYGAKYTADSLSVGDIQIGRMPMMINQAPMSQSLLGMTFLRRLESFHVEGTRLYLKSRP